MIQFVNLLKFSNIIVCVYLRCRKAAVPQQVFNGLYVCAVIKQVRGKSVAQYVRASFLQRCGSAKVSFYGTVNISGI